MADIILTPVFDGSINIALVKNAKNDYTLSWDDGVANEWVEDYPTLSAALARAAVLAACGETGWDKGFAEQPETFTASAAEFLTTQTS